MNVKELIEELKTFPEDTRVVYEFDSIYGDISAMTFEDEWEWFPDSNDIIGTSLQKTGNKIVIMN